MGELWVLLMLGSFFAVSFGLIRLIERVQWKAGDRK